MPTSGVNTYSPTRNTILYAALRLVGAYASTSTPRAEQVRDANTALNLMFQTWRAEGFLWKQRFATLTTTVGQAVYQLGPSGAAVYTGTAVDIAVPSRVFDANRVSTVGTEVPLIPISRSEYAQIPNKTQVGTPNQYYFDAQSSAGGFYLWPAPDAGTPAVNMSVDVPLDIMLDDADNYDFPQYWLEAIKYGLGVRLAPEYALSQSERVLLIKEYEAIKKVVLDHDREFASTHFGVQL